MEIDLTRIKPGIPLTICALLFCIFEFFSYPNEIKLHLGIYDTCIYFFGAVVSSNVLLMLLIRKKTIKMRTAGLLIGLVLCSISVGFSMLGLALRGLGGSPSDWGMLTKSYNFLLLLSAILATVVFSYWVSPSRKKLHAS